MILVQSDDEVFETDGLHWSDAARTGAVAVITIIATIVVIRLVRRAVERATSNVGLARFLGRVSGGITFGIGLFYALTGIGVRIGPLLGVLGIGGLALAFALQDIVENLISSVFLQVQKQFDIGDEVITNDREGVVEDVNFRSVWIRTFDGELVVIPASMVLKNAVRNQTAFELRRTTLTVGVEYGTDLDLARTTLIEATRATDGVSTIRPPEAWVTTFGESSIDLDVWFWHAPQRYTEFKVRDAVARNAKRALDDAGITIPFPQRVLHLEAPVEVRDRPETGT